ncbi:MAG: hypothetical protein IPK32_04035 [Verrucomicrobiaceae bacterium]|nr:hypothetical protein [Verrucomicrobiaceae bacterium]
MLTGITPLGGAPGASVELTLRGADLDGPKAVMIGDRSISLSTVTKAALVLPADMPEGIHDLRFIGRYGVSNPRVFQISKNAVTESPGTNAKPDKALAVKVGDAIQGIFKATTPQWFSFEAKKGQVITASYDGHRFDTRTELLGAITDVQGRELARMTNGKMVFTAPADGLYRLRLHELMHRTGDDYAFRVVLGVTSPNNPAAQVSQTSLAVPSAIKGAFQGIHSYDLSFKAGQRFVIQVLSHQLGHATDPHLVIENIKADGSTTAQAEVADAPAISPAPGLKLENRDPVYAYEAKADGKFRITLNDNFATSLPFELNITEKAVDRLMALNTALPKAANAKNAELGYAIVMRGGIHALEVVAMNRHSLSEAIELSADKLPSGLTCLGGFIGKGQSLGYLAFQAAADAPAGAGLVRSIPQSAYVSFVVADTARDNVLVRSSGPPCVGVSTLSTPALIQTEKTDILEVAADAKLEIPLKVTRHAQFTDAIKLKALGLTDVAKAPEADIPAKTAAGKFTLDVKALKLAPGEYGFILQGSAKMSVRRNLEELAEAEKKVKEAAEALKLAKNDEEFAKLSKKNLKSSEGVAEINSALKETADKVAQATLDKTAADTALKAQNTKAAPKDATFIVWSNPIRVRVVAVAAKK